MSNFSEEEVEERGSVCVCVSLVHFHLCLPLQQRHSSQLDVDVVDALVEEVSGPLGDLMASRRREEARQRRGRSQPVSGEKQQLAAELTG